MTQPLPSLYIARHGETAWTITKQHTGLSDIPLTPRGEQNARALAGRLGGRTFSYVFTSPSMRARRTCELAGFGAAARVDPDLSEWHYGAYEGLTTQQIRKERPDWQLFRDGCPGGESVAEIGARADRVIARLRATDADVLVFSSGHFSRVIAARWCGMEPARGKSFYLDTAALSILGYENSTNDPVVRLWNDTRHVSA
jgi:broad specificity phosphatase PhoE